MLSPALKEAWFQSFLFVCPQYHCCRFSNWSDIMSDLFAYLSKSSKDQISNSVARSCSGFVWDAKKLVDLFRQLPSYIELSRSWENLHLFCRLCAPTNPCENWDRCERTLVDGRTQSLLQATFCFPLLFSGYRNTIISLQDQFEIFLCLSYSCKCKGHLLVASTAAIE